MNGSTSLPKLSEINSSGCGRVWHCCKPINFAVPDVYQSSPMIAVLFKEILNEKIYGNLTIFAPAIPLSLRKVKPGETFPQEKIHYKRIYFF